MNQKWKPPKHVERMRKLENQYEKDVVKVVKGTTETITLFPQILITALIAADPSIISTFMKFAEITEVCSMTRESIKRDLKPEKVQV